MCSAHMVQVTESRSSRWLAAAISMSVLAACNATQGSTAGSEDSAGRRAALAARIDEVVDGDTVRLTVDGRTETVRLIGIDTPETKHPSKPVECFGPEAAAHTAELLPEGTRVGLIRDVEARDRYGRLLAYIVRADDGLFVNLDLVAGGWATTLAIGPNTTHAEEFAAAAETARAASLGLWGACER